MDLKDTVQRTLPEGLKRPGEFHRMQNMSGGHVWGFICGPKLLPAAILRALDLLQPETDAVGH
jgi:hypothetical protein